ncbi:MAG: hypothetical protein AAF222_08575 [Pseudomonadota bacterium]
MEQKTRRHWSLFLGIWSLAAMAPVVLTLPIFVRAFWVMTPPDRTRPDVFRDNLEADLMLAAICVICFVALIQTISRHVRSAKQVWSPQLAVWGALGAGMLAVAVFDPQPAPLRVTLGEQQYVVPRGFTPKSTYRYIPREKKSVPIFEFYVCAGTAARPFDAECDSIFVSVDLVHATLPPGTPKRAAANLNRHLFETGLSMEEATAKLVDTDGNHRLFKLPSGPKIQSAWLTLREDDTVHRFVRCRKLLETCWATFDAGFAHVSYAMRAGGSQTLSDRDAFEENLRARFDNWAR